MSLQYLIKEPKIKLDKNPLLLLLHGYGSNEEDLFSFANELPDNYYIISARAPYDLILMRMKTNFLITNKENHLAI